MTASLAPADTRRIHIVNAHMTYPNWSEGALNNAMAEKARTHLLAQGHAVTYTKIEDAYVPEHEMQRHLEADLVILQTPMNWFGPPWIYKRYVDEVFNVGLHTKKFQDKDGRTRSDPTRQYGTGGRMHGRGFFVSATWTAPASTFGNPDSVLFEGQGLDDVLLNISTAYKFVGYTVLEHYSLFDIFHGTDIPAGIHGYSAHLDTQLAALDRYRVA